MHEQNKNMNLPLLPGLQMNRRDFDPGLRVDSHPDLGDNKLK